MPNLCKKPLSLSPFCSLSSLPCFLAVFKISLCSVCSTSGTTTKMVGLYFARLRFTVRMLSFMYSVPPQCSAPTMFVISSKVWLGGRMDSPASSGDSGSADIAAVQWLPMLRWVRMTQRLSEVVPEVKYSAAGSSGASSGKNSSPGLCSFLSSSCVSIISRPLILFASSCAEASQLLS